MLLLEGVKNAWDGGLRKAGHLHTAHGATLRVRCGFRQAEIFITPLITKCSKSKISVCVCVCACVCVPCTKPPVNNSHVQRHHCGCCGECQVQHTGKSRLCWDSRLLISTGKQRMLCFLSCRFVHHWLQ